MMDKIKETLHKKKIDVKQATENKINTYITIGLAVFAVLTLAVFVYLNVERTYYGYKEISKSKRTDLNTKGYMSYQDDKIIKYSCDGITVMDRDEKLIWNASYEMKNPKVVTCEDYIAVADIGNKSVYVYDKDGNASEIDNVLSISQIKISSNGIVAMVVEDEMANYIKICDKKKLYIEIKTRIKEDGYPIDIAFSQDSQKLVTSYISAQEGVCKNYVTFYNFGEVGKNYESKIVKAESYNETMVPRIEFLDEDTVCTFLENKLVVYSMKEIPEEKFATEEFDKKIKSIFYNDEYIGVILDNDNKNTIKVYNFDGKEKLNESIECKYDNVYLSKDDIVMYTQNDVKILRLSGKLKLSCTFDTKIEYLLPYNNRDKFLAITNSDIIKIKLVE